MTTDIAEVGEWTRHCITSTASRGQVAPVAVKGAGCDVAKRNYSQLKGNKDIRRIL
jgi:hypothetical protein